MSDANASVSTPGEKMKFESRSGELYFQTLFTEPAFTLFQNLPGLTQHVFARLNRHGLRLADMKFEIGNGSLAEHQLTCSLLNYSTSVRFRIDTVEINSFNLHHLSEEQIGDVAVSALEALKLYSAATIFATYQLSVAAHGVVGGASGQEFVRRFTNPPSGGEWDRSSEVAWLCIGVRATNGSVPRLQLMFLPTSRMVCSFGLSPFGTPRKHLSGRSRSWLHRLSSRRSIRSDLLARSESK